MKVITRTDNQSAKDAAAFIIATVAGEESSPDDIKRDDSSDEECEFEPEVARELKVQLCEKFGVDISFQDFLESINVPDKIWNALNGLDEWEAEAEAGCHALIYALKNKHFSIASHLANKLGAQIAKQLLKGYFDAPSIVSKGLKNLKRGKSFQPQAGRQINKREAIRVVIAFYCLKFTGVEKPTQSKVREALGADKLSSGTISKIFKKLGLRDFAGDGRSTNKRRPKKLDKLPIEK